MSQSEVGKAGLAALVGIYRADLRAFLIARCGDPTEAEDVLQELWLKTSGLAARPIANGRAYLFRVANNLVLDRLRARHRAMHRDLNWLKDTSGGLVAEDRRDPTLAADEALLRDEEARILREAIAELPPGARRALELHRFENHDQAEVAHIMGISRSGVEKHLATAMKHLRRALADCGYFDAVASMGHGAAGERS
jgi:RNA polymerase sigma-70 factor (ECF subfamily)